MPPESHQMHAPQGTIARHVAYADVDAILVNIATHEPGKLGHVVGAGFHPMYGKMFMFGDDMLMRRCNFPRYTMYHTTRDDRIRRSKLDYGCTPTLSPARRSADD